MSAERVVNDCTRCAARLDGMSATYCYHRRFERSYPGDGRPIVGYPAPPSWCPGMIPAPVDLGEPA